MSYYLIGQRVLLRQDRGGDVWAPGVVLEQARTAGGLLRYQARLDEPDEDGKREHYYSQRWVIADTPRNRKAKRVSP